MSGTITYGQLINPTPEELEETSQVDAAAFLGDTLTGSCLGGDWDLNILEQRAIIGAQQTGADGAVMNVLTPRDEPVVGYSHEGYLPNDSDVHIRDTDGGHFQSSDAHPVVGACDTEAGQFNHGDAHRIVSRGTEGGVQVWRRAPCRPRDTEAGQFSSGDAHRVVSHGMEGRAYRVGDAQSVVGPRVTEAGQFNRGDAHRTVV
ncbi:hypothetical protein EUX98_g3923 [Antrodiella citrinella]|uniref:Uncharacterized protein n=1 Tax=Antrodiella citrinella TaxID=2447956 RepID=A0A4S4MV98_9APHY|nr:hypothetical protein EUX98_g3923 [Antrodiella citrinella]